MDTKLGENLMNTVVDKSQVAPTNNFLKFEMASIENKIKEKIKEMWKAGYSYVIICEYATNALGIQRCTQIMKAISKVQNILDKINGDLNDLKKLLEELQSYGFGNIKWYYQTKDGKFHESNQPFDPSKTKPKDSWLPKGAHWVTPTEQMCFAIQVWLKKGNDLGIKGPDGKTLTNQQAMQYIWKELYGPKCDNKAGLVNDLKEALNNPWYKQTNNQSYKALAALNGKALFGGDSASAWTDGKNGPTFLDFLKGGKYSTWGIADILEKAFTDSYYKNNNTTPPSNSGAKPKDYVGDLTSSSDAVVQSGTALNSTESSDLSMFAQQLSSLINIIQQMLQQNDKSNTAMVNNQQAR
ncbi:MAG: hypothetical protein K940chlam5_00140 [Candidatus Anoxychlamydiales bacterium]|nr:hypothetical protein [Candidatus Anoxychlamydiales bacterium]